MTTVTQLRLLVVCNEAQILLDAMRTADRALTKLLAFHTPEDAEYRCGAVYTAYARLKVHLLRRSGDDASSSVRCDP